MFLYGNYRLLNEYFAAYRALLALRKSGFRACRFLAGYDNGCMRESGNGFRLCYFTSCTREGLYARSRAGCRFCNLAGVPCMTESRALCIRLRADFAAGAYKLILCRRRAGCRLLQYFGILVRMSLCGLRRAASYALAVGAVCVSESGNTDCILRVASVSCACVCHYAL